MPEQWPMNSDRPLPGPGAFKPNALLVVAGIIGLLGAPLAWWAVQPFQVNIIQYQLQRAEGDPVWSVLAFSLAVFLSPFVIAFLASRIPANGQRAITFLVFCAPMLLSLPLGCVAFSSKVPPFLFLLLAIFGAGTTAYFAGLQLRNQRGGLHRLALFSIVAVIGLWTVVHVQIQLNFYNHFMLGHADIGHFTEELKNALAGRGLRSDSFDNTRLGWHFVPLMFVLVPGYALWPSITYLMTLGPLVLHLGALPVFWLVRRRTDCVLTAWLCALAWLLLPSLSRLVYSNTYGFAWLYTSVPVLCLVLGGVVLQRWKLCWVLVGVLLLSRETHTAITLGIGTYLALFTVRRRAGILIMAISVAYALLCAEFIIPYFAKAGRYERLDMFGDLGASVGALAISAFTKPGVFFGRLIRPQSINFLLLILSTIYFLPMRGWRLALAALPSLLVHLLLQGTDWISIKFWHHAMVLPILFFAALSLLTRRNEVTSYQSTIAHAEVPRQRNLGIALALVICAAWGHYFFGFSPLSKSYEAYARDSFLQNPDPRLDAVNRLRGELPRDRTVLATERLAAHFIDYKRLYTGRRPRRADFIVLDRSDQWDTSGLPSRAQEFASNGEYDVFAEEGPIIVFARKPNAPSLDLED
jgi:uncharacterized membrane protein